VIDIFTEGNVQPSHSADLIGSRSAVAPFLTIIYSSIILKRIEWRASSAAYSTAAFSSFLSRSKMLSYTTIFQDKGNLIAYVSLGFGCGSGFGSGAGTGSWLATRFPAPLPAAIGPACAVSGARALVSPPIWSIGGLIENWCSPGFWTFLLLAPLS